MVLVPDKTRKVALVEIDYSEYSIGDLFANSLAAKRQVSPNWTDEAITDPGVQLLSVFSSLTHIMQQSVNQAARNCSLVTADRREAVRVLARQVGHIVKEVEAAVATVQFTLTMPHDEFTIPAGSKLTTDTQLTTEAIPFETIADKVVLSTDTSVLVPVRQGETILNETIGSSDGTARQKFYLQRRAVIWGSESVQVFDGAAWGDFTRVDDFVESDSDDKHYIVTIDNEGWVYLQFGDGAAGSIPTIGTNNVRCTYRIGGGISGNVAANTITDLLAVIENVESVTNPAPATGGSDAETLRHAKMVALAKWKAQRTGIRSDSIQALLLDYVSVDHGAIAQSIAVGIDNLTIDVRFVPANGGVPSTAFKDEVQAYLSLHKAVLTEIRVSDPTFLAVDYNVEIWIADGYLRDQVIEQVRQAIVRFGSATYRDADGIYPNGFGAVVALSKLSREIQNIKGIDRLVINSPATDLSMPLYQIRTINSIEITANQGNVSVSRTILNFEL